MYNGGAARLPVDARVFGEASQAFDLLLEVEILQPFSRGLKVEG